MRVLAMIALAYIALTAAWVLSTRPFGGPDETAHYLKAISVSNGQLVGPRAPNTLLAVQGPLSALGRQWEQRSTRAVRVPAALSPPGAHCIDQRADVRGSCTESTYTGTYPLLGYLAPAVAVRLSGHVASASWLARFASALPATAFVLITLLILFDGTVWSLGGAVLALTPMVLFTDSLISPSGLEIAAATAFLAALLAIVRAPAAPARWLWAAAGLSGVVTVLTWQLGPLFVAVALAFFVGLLTPRGVLDLVRSRRREALGVAGALAVSLVLYGLYTSVAHGAPTTVALARVGDLHAGLDQVWPSIRQAVGAFGQISVALPGSVIDTWLVLVAALVMAALALGRGAERWVLAGACALAVILPVLLDALIQRHTGFGMQGRYLLPVFMAVPILAGETLRRSQRRRGARALLAPGVGLVALLQLAAWWVNARASAGHPGSVWFVSGAHWAPPGGWWPPLIAATLGSGLLVVAGLLSAYGPRPGSSAPSAS